MEPLIEPAKWHARLHFALVFAGICAMSFAALREDRKDMAKRWHVRPPYEGASLVYGFLIVAPAFAAITYLSVAFLALDFNWLAAWEGALRTTLIDCLALMTFCLAYSRGRAAYNPS